MRFPTRRETLLGAFALLLGAVALPRACRKAPSAVLKADEAQKVTINLNTKTISSTKRTKTGKIKSSILSDGGRNATITVKNDGTVTVNAETHGGIFEPGAVVFMSDTLRGGLDVQLYYWHRWSLSTGIGTDGHNADLYGAINYVLPFEQFSNTSLLVGYSGRRALVVGVRIKF
jgi:hypothetical protein